MDDAAVDRSIGECDAILDASMRVHFTAERLSHATHLKLFVTATTGADHVDAPTLSARGVPLLTLRGQTEILRDLTPAAEHSWLLLLACARHLRAAVQDVLAGEWDRSKFPGTMLRGKTLGIVGCGRIGQWMSQYAAAFGLRCLGYDPHVNPWPAHIQRSELRTLLMTADFISVHVALTDETRGLLGRREFQLMKKGAVLINTSRGDIADETEILSALCSGQLAAAGLDVLVGEPRIEDHPLVAYARTHSNLILTPHIGGFSPDALKHVLAFSCRRIASFFDQASNANR